MVWICSLWICWNCFSFKCRLIRYRKCSLWCWSICWWKSWNCFSFWYRLIRCSFRCSFCLSWSSFCLSWSSFCLSWSSFCLSWSSFCFCSRGRLRLRWEWFTKIFNTFSAWCWGSFRTGFIFRTIFRC